MPETNGHGPAAGEQGAGNHGNGHQGDGHRLASLTLVPRAATRSAAKDFKSDQEVRWCPGCGDYAILAAFQAFLPDLHDGSPASLFTPAFVSDRSDGKIAHLDGVNLSRAWCWRGLASALDPALAALARDTADAHLDASLPYVAGDYMGEHWLATFALLALEEAD